MLGKLTLYTSGSTKEPKLITHDSIEIHIQRSIKEIGLTSADIVLDVFPSNVIAHYTVTAQPALTAKAHLISANFDPYKYIHLFNKFRPTVIGLIPSHIAVLEKIKGWHSLDMSCVRYMITGSQPVNQLMIDNLRGKGVQLVANWYGMTEMPPPVLIGYNTEQFNLTPTPGYTVEFTDGSECIINGVATGDLFDVTNKKFLRRKGVADGQTWKTNL